MARNPLPKLAYRVVEFKLRRTVVDEVRDLVGFESAPVVAERQLAVENLYRRDQARVSVRDISGVLQEFPDPAR